MSKIATVDQTYKPGRTYYMRDGSMVEYLGQMSDKRHVACQLVEIETYDGRETVPGGIVFASELFAKPPVEHRSQEVAALEAKVSELEKRKSALYANCLSAEQEIRVRLDKLKRYAGLELLEDLIDGKITHFVVCESEYGIDLKIKTAAETIEKGGSSDDGWDKSLRLVTLFGKSNGDLQWKVNRYYDGSGSHKTIWPCRSEDEAQKTIAAIYQKMVDENFPHATEDRGHWFLVSYEKAVSVGLQQKAEVAERYRELKQAALLKQEAAARTELQKAQSRLDELLKLQIGGAS